MQGMEEGTPRVNQAHLPGLKTHMAAPSGWQGLGPNGKSITGLR